MKPSRQSVEHWERGKTLSESGQVRKAIEEFSKATERDPDWTLPYFWRAGQYEELADFRLAITDYTTFIELDTGSVALMAEAYAGRAYSYKSQGDYQNAIQDYSAELELNPQSALGYLDRSLVHDPQGNEEAAYADYEKAIQLDPTVASLAKGRPIRRSR